MKIALDIATHPRTAAVWANLRKRGMLVELLRIAAASWAGRRGGTVVLTTPNLVSIMGQQHSSNRSSVSALCLDLGWPVDWTEFGLIVTIDNFSENQGFNSATRGETPRTPSASESDSDSESESKTKNKKPRRSAPRKARGKGAASPSDPPAAAPAPEPADPTLGQQVVGAWVDAVRKHRGTKTRPDSAQAGRLKKIAERLGLERTLAAFEAFFTAKPIREHYRVRSDGYTLVTFLALADRADELAQAHARAEAREAQGREIDAQRAAEMTPEAEAEIDRWLRHCEVDA